MFNMEKKTHELAIFIYNCKVDKIIVAFCQ